ncbi:MAG: peptidase M28, partial [Hymenobacter sp.]|nr:peptidase M28 [Hymenobacter sp.]
MRARALLSFLGSLLLTTAAAQPAQPPKALRQPLSNVSAADYEAHVRYLADDKLRGRLPGTAGYQLAVDYVVAQYKMRGVLPAGDNGTYLQTVRLRRAYTEPGATLRLQLPDGPDQALTYGPDFTLYPNPAEATTTVAAPLVFAGFGISTPELGYDDYAGLDASGKIVVVTREEPRQFPDAVRLYNTDLLTVLQTAARHGAVGVLLAAVKPTARLPDPPKGVVSVLGPDGKVAVSRTYGGARLRVVGSVSAATLHRLFGGAATDTTRVL